MGRSASLIIFSSKTGMLSVPPFKGLGILISMGGGLPVLAKIRVGAKKMVVIAANKNIFINNFVIFMVVFELNKYIILKLKKSPAYFGF